MSDVEDVVGGDGWISDESSFMGDDDLKQRWENMLNQHETFWAQHAILPAVIAASAVQEMRSSHKSKPSAMMQTKPLPAVASEVVEISDDEAPVETITAPLHTPQWHWDGRDNHLQSTETAAAFVARLPPSQTSTLEHSWIWAHNPYHDFTKDKHPNESIIRDDGSKLLSSYIDLKKALVSTLKKQGKSKQDITKAVQIEAKKLQQGLHEVAIKAECLSGKWMLFPSLAKLDQTWQKVAEAVVTGTLGPTAKVSPSADADKDSGLICIYTDDFSNQKDVKRVLVELVMLGLVELNSPRPTYYKCDAYTYWGLYSGHKFDFGSTIYNSNEMLRDLLQSKGKVDMSSHFQIPKGSPASKEYVF